MVGRRAHRASRHRLRVRAGRRGRGAARPALAAPAARGARPSPASSTSPGFRGPTPAGAGCRWPASVLYEMHVGTFTPEGTFDAAIGKLAASGRPRRRRGGAAAVQRLFAGSAAGGTTASISTPSTSPTADRRGCCASSTPRHAYDIARGDGRRLQPSRPGRELPGPLRPLLHRHARHALGRGGQPRRAALRRGARVPARQPADVGARLPRGRHPPRRRARAARRPGRAHPRGARGRGGGAVRARRQAAVPHRRDATRTTRC